MSEVELGELVVRFRSGAVPRAEWTHEAHVRVGAAIVHELGAVAGLVELRARIRHLNEQNGVGNTPTGGYHETITAAYAALFGEFWASLAPSASRADGVAVLLASPLADRAFLHRFYSRELLFSEVARTDFVPPDLAALRLDPAWLRP